MKALVTVTSLLLSTALLLVGHGMQLTLLPLRAGFNGLSESIIGAGAAFYFLGFIAGCLLIPRLIARVGHIRCFAVLAALMISAVLLLEVFADWRFWLLLRLVTGVAICGLYAVIESWLTSQASTAARGQVLAIYTVITLLAMMLGQFMINVGPVEDSTPFTVAAVFIALAIIPVGLTRRMAPAQVEPIHSGLRLLYQRSHSAFFGALVSGLVVGGFWALGAVFASQGGADQMAVTWFMSTAIAGGALLQYPLGWLSDRYDRRYLLVALCAGGGLAAVAVALSVGTNWQLPVVFVFGAMVMPLYAISLATAADVSSADEFVAMGTSVLLLHSIGAVIASLALGQLMNLLGASFLFWASALLCAFFALLILALTRQPREVTVDEQIPFTMAAADAAPLSFELDPRTIEVEDVESPVESGDGQARQSK